MSEFKVGSAEANRWWQKNTVLGVLLNRLMLLFIAIPIGLVVNNMYEWSLLVFAFMIPYGFLLRYMAVCAVRSHLVIHPEEMEEFETQRIIFR